MGNGVNVQAGNVNPDSELFTFKVLQNEYEAIKQFNIDKPEKALNETQIYDCLQLTYRSAIEEWNTDLPECKNPGVILFKYLQLSSAEQTEYIELITTTATTKEKDLLKIKKAVKVEDYTKSFGGTEADSKNEKDAAELLRGEKQLF